ncbi:GTP pyrophosphokinase [Bajunvirus bajun]|uniref:GTP pyrophosphokinase n=1 Tax=Brevundimonas phage vB_BgoS-Bajun TaxID=2948594 RepID=A0A9E7N5W6_9CAUD|nr:GTP pyrophosphokinase [Brevundimonas phage vB_BgoS-Bajun]
MPAKFAAEAHGDQQYAGLPYSYHLEKVEGILKEFGFTGEDWIAAARLHDVIEDTMKDLTPEERREIVRKKFGADVTLLVWAVSGIGPNRKARNESIYAKLAEYPRACTLKVADRIANVEASVKDPGTGQVNIGMAKMYLKERARFREVCRNHVIKPLWDRLERAYEAAEAALVAAGSEVVPEPTLRAEAVQAKD